MSPKYHQDAEPFKCQLRRNMGYVDTLYDTATTNVRRIDGLVQERRNSIVNALELGLFHTYPSICKRVTYGIVVVNIVEDIGHFIAGLKTYGTVLVLLDNWPGALFINTGIGAWIRSYIHVQYWGVIHHPGRKYGLRKTDFIPVSRLVIRYKRSAIDILLDSLFWYLAIFTEMYFSFILIKIQISD